MNRSDASFKPFLSPSCVPTALLGGAAAGLGSSLSAVPGGQPSAPNLNPPSQIDPSSIERAYAALGLTYQGNQIQTQTAQPNMSNQALQGQAGLRPLNPMGKFSSCLLASLHRLTRFTCPVMGCVLAEEALKHVPKAQYSEREV